MLPAYPNPANRAINFTFEIPRSDKVNLYLKNNSGIIVKKILDGIKLAAGAHTIVLNIADESIEAGNYRVFLEAGNFFENGDIKIVK